MSLKQLLEKIIFQKVLYHYIIFIILISVTTLLFANKFYFLKFTAFQTILLLIATLLPINLVNIIKINYINKIILFLARYKRNLGILTGLFALSHALYAIFILEYLRNDLTNLFNTTFILGFTSILIFSLLLLTSFTTIQKKLSNWKQIHSVIWMISPFILVHGYYAGNAYFQETSPILLFLVAIGLFTLIKFIWGRSIHDSIRDLILFVLGCFFAGFIYFR